MLNSFEDLFGLDEERTHLIRVGSKKSLLRSYKEKINFKNLNSSAFWAHKLSQVSEKNPMKDDRISCVANLLTSKKGKLLNIGVGDGKLETKVKNKKLTKYGLDITLFGLTEANTQQNFQPIVGNILNLPFREKFDVITVLEVLEHLFHTDIFDVLKNLRRLLSKSGRLIISVPINEDYTSKFNPNGHYRRYSKELIVKELELAGYSIKNVKELYAFHKLYRIKSVIAKITHKWKPNVVIIEAAKKQ